ncbi:MAG: uncharacterized protein K0Q97_868 [Bacillota bacterium]|jgi:hypothetical protein|nr:uncharacterized protein [Bacillota bacterium]
MNYEEYIYLVKRRLNNNFKFNDNIEEKGVKINLHAQSIYMSEKLIERNILPFSSYKILEKYYLKHFNSLTESDIQEYLEFLISIANEESESCFHIQKCIVGIMVCDKTNDSLLKYIKNLKYTKPYKLYFKGWSEVQLLCVDLNSNSLYFNEAAKEKSKIFVL